MSFGLRLSLRLGWCLGWGFVMDSGRVWVWLKGYDRAQNTACGEVEVGTGDGEMAAGLVGDGTRAGAGSEGRAAARTEMCCQGLG